MRSISASLGFTARRVEQLRLGLVAAQADRELGRADATAREVGEEALHPAVLERVEGDRRQPAALDEQPQAAGERAVERVELAVDGDPDRLEGALRGMAAAEAIRGRNRGADRLDQLAGGLERPPAGDLGGDRARVALLAELADRRRQPRRPATR